MKNNKILICLLLFIILIFGLIISNRKESFFGSKVNIDKIFNNIMTNDKFKKYTPVLVNKDPWIITLDSFLTHEECKELRELPKEWKLSNLQSGDNKEYRNSYSYDCNNGCLNINIVKKIQNRIESISSISKQNYEDMTLTKYYKGGFFKIHHDYIDKDSNPDTFNKIGPRIITCLIYLSDSESHNLDGGATSFNQLKYDVKPKLGRALIWTNVNNNLEKDDRTSHEAKPILNGTKFISQTWIHPKKYT
jgi:prolyl 4-hydroxylase